MTEQVSVEGSNSVSVTNEKKEDFTVAVEILEEKTENLSEVPNKHIVTAGNTNSSNNPRYYENQNQRGYGQTPYYQQQNVGGQPVYVQVLISHEHDTKIRSGKDTFVFLHCP